ncbi:MAG: MarR family transcriptional regulator [Cyclobacteriaceae bacterium]|nr:MarR family transcriptional regulator [Cyclobacteriaceae bacterium]
MNSINTKLIRKFRNNIRQFDRELFFQNVSSCCNGVTLPQCHALLEIESNEDISVTELAKKLTLEKSTVSRTIDVLVRKGFIKREIPSNNRRITKLLLTAEGTKTCNSINWKNDGFISETLNCLNENEQTEFVRLFEKITGKLVRIREIAHKC